MKIEYIQCLLLNKKNVKAKRQLSELKKENPIYNSLSIELLMEGYKEFTSN